MIVDCHTHWGIAWQDKTPRDPTAWLAVLDQYNISHAVVLPEAGLVDARCIASNHDDMAAACAASAGRMLPFATTNAMHGEAVPELRRCLDELNFRGIKFHPWLQGCSVSHPAMDEVCELAAASNAPILFHDGTPPFSLPSQIALLAKRHPRATIILGHCGLFEHWREAAAAMKATTNLWGCLCSPHLGAMRELVNRCDKNRLVWGSDFGYGLADIYAYRIPLMNQMRLSDSEYEMIVDTNPKRLLQL